MYPVKRFAQRRLSHRRSNRFDQNRRSLSSVSLVSRRRLHAVHEQSSRVPEASTRLLESIREEETLRVGSAAASTPLLPTTTPGNQQLLELIRRHQEDELAVFFRTICSSVRRFQPANVIKMKRILSAAIHDTEMKELDGTDAHSLSPPVSLDGDETLLGEDTAENDLEDDVFM